MVDQKAVEKLLRLVAEGEQDQAEEMLKKDKNLLLVAGTVTDLSGREFKQITAFQYALWALDWHMWRMMQKYLPTEVQAEQFNALESKGTAHGKHFSLQPLIDALQKYVDNAEEVWKYGYQATDHWCKKVGGAQRLLPVHVVNEYCHPTRLFYPCSEFKEDVLLRSRSYKLWDYFESKYVDRDWFTFQYDGGKVGDSFAYARGASVLVEAVGKNVSTALQGWAVVARDRQSIQTLSKIRIQQLELLSSQLSSAASHTQTFGAK